MIKIWLTTSTINYIVNILRDAFNKWDRMNNCDLSFYRCFQCDIMVQTELWFDND